MKKLTLLLALLPFFCFSQTKVSVETFRFVKEYQKAALISKNTSVQFEQLKGNFPVQKINNQLYVSFLAKVNNSFNSETVKSTGIIYGPIYHNITSLRVPVDKIGELETAPWLDYAKLAEKVSTQLAKAIKDTRVDSVQAGLGLPQPFTGKDVIIGITDWGFDYTNPMFMDTTFSHTRILKAWDMFRNNGPAPAGFSYGTEIDGETALMAAQCDTFNVYQWATHGSHVAGICGGNGAGTADKGVAFESEYLLATFLVEEAAVFDAFYWMKENAEAMGKRLVVNMSWGLYYMGNLDGTSLLSQIIDQMSSEGVVFVTSAGNNGSENFHLKFTPASIDDTLRTVVNFDNYAYYPTMWGQSMTLWGTPGHPFETGIKILSSSNIEVASSPRFSTSVGSAYIEDTLFVGTDTIWYNIAFENANAENGRPFMRIRVRNTKTSLYKVALSLTADSTVHMWNIIELSNDVGNWGLPFYAPIAGYTAGDRYYGIGEPACAHSAISIAAYTSEVVGTGGTTGGTIASFSSYGPAFGDYLKPDIAAPGVSVCSSISSFTNQSIAQTSICQTFDFNGRTYKFAKFSGTSMSSPMVCGIVALMLQANPLLTVPEIKDIIRYTAREDNRTGNIPDTGSTRWGWGKIHAWRAVYTTINGINPIEKEALAIIYPNPANEYFSVYLPENVTGKQIVLYNLLGKEVFTNNFDANNKFEIQNLPEGIYIIEVKSSAGVFTGKLIIQ
ncbi:MAG: hypothetical protein CVU05_04890 [Bacteroidetes bacterium HGW-Bacteroidetes-21]|jgi:subtilisin family serine protease|nr:MAG: hypothetical protein CVU05_04890 [Bacteroidetes bacterium HGW-Bacteroidetes-21]